MHKYIMTHTKHLDLARSRVVQAIHTLHFSKGNEITIFKSMTSFIKTCDNTFSILYIKSTTHMTLIVVIDLHW